MGIPEGPPRLRHELAPHAHRSRVRRMQKKLESLEISVKQYTKWTGGDGLEDFLTENPGWSFKEWAALLIENLDTIKVGDSIRKRPAGG